MNALTRVTLALAAASVCSMVSAAPAKLPPEAAAAHAAAGRAIHQRLVDMKSQRAKAVAADAGIAAVDATGSGPRLANPYRAYPPSCLADPLPTTPTHTLASFQMPLYSRDELGNPVDPETVTITLWRIPCSSSGNLTPYNVDQGANAALLMRISRSQSNEGRTDQFPTFPALSSDQGNSSGNLVRAAVEPNTVIADGPYDSPIYNSTTYVLENYPYSGAGYTYYNYDFTLVIDPVFDFNCTGCQAVNINGYVPTPQDYPAAFQDLPIDGYMSSAWYDTSHGGEGLVVEIYDNPGNTTRTIFAAWYTYDASGIPFWLVAQGVASIGSNVFANVPVYYYSGGGFAGNFSGVDSHVWGTMNISFPDCMTMHFTYNGATDDSVIVGGPSGSGERFWTRLADINGLNCE
jgi:hypothetical protein